MTAPGGEKIQRQAATTKGATKWMTPYGSHAMTSRKGLVHRVRRSEMLAPYRTDSRVGRTETQMCGRQLLGINWDE